MSEIWVVGWTRLPNGRTRRGPHERHSGILVPIIVERQSREMAREMARAAKKALREAKR